MCGTEDEGRHDKSLVDGKFHVELVLEIRKMECIGLRAARWRVVRTRLCQTSMCIIESYEIWKRGRWICLEATDAGDQRV
jgi:hypothetical protein